MSDHHNNSNNNHDSRSASPQITITRQSSATPPRENNEAFHFVGTDRKRSILDEELERLRTSLGENEAHEDDDGKTSNGISNKGTSHSDQNKSRAGDGELNGKGTSESGAGGASLNSNGNVVQNKSVKVCVIL